jgi:hypothetical protein
MPFGTPASLRRSRIALRAVTLALVVTMVFLAACGGKSADKPQMLSADEKREVDQAESEIHSYCRRLALYLVHRTGPPTSADSGGALAAADRLIALAQQKPDSLYRAQDPMRLALDDLAEDLEGTNCSHEIEQKLNQALAGLPAQ